MLKKMDLIIITLYKIINLSKEICYIQDYNEIDKILKLYYDR